MEGRDEKILVEMATVGEDGPAQTIQFSHRGPVDDALKEGLSVALEVPKDEISLKFGEGSNCSSDKEEKDDQTNQTTRSSSGGSSGSLRPHSSRAHPGGSADGMDEDLRLDIGQEWVNAYSDVSDNEGENYFKKQRVYCHENWLWSLGSLENPDRVTVLLRAARDTEQEYVSVDFAPLPQYILADRLEHHYAHGGPYSRPGDGHFGARSKESGHTSFDDEEKLGAYKFGKNLNDKSTEDGIGPSSNPFVRPLSVRKLAESEAASKLEHVIVRVEKGDGEFVARLVKIDRHVEKPLHYLGGYKDKRNGAIYLNREQQTIEEKEKPTTTVVEKFTRATQKYDVRLNFQNTIKEAYTQVARRHVLSNNAFDKVMIPKKYKDAAWWEWNCNRAATIIQRYVRRHFAKCLAAQMRIDRENMKKFFTEQERLEREDAKLALRHEIERRMHPETRADFDILYSELEGWRYKEVKKIHAMKLGHDEHIKAMQELLYKETKLLQKITKMKKSAIKKIVQGHITKKMKKMSSPKLWELTNGTVIHVTTPYTSRASDLMHLYYALAKENTSIDERMGVLGYIKWTVQEHTSNLTKEILMLIEREANFMYRGRPIKAISALRQRILNLFLMFIETPEFNREARMFEYVHPDFDGGDSQFPTRRNCCEGKSI